MELKRQARRYYPLRIAVSVDGGAPTTVAGWQASFDGGSNYLAADESEAGIARWLVAGPEVNQTTDPNPGPTVANPAGTVVLTASVTPKLRLRDNPELEVEDGPTIHLI